MANPASAQSEQLPDLFTPVPVNEITSFYQDPAAIRQDNVYINHDVLGFFGSEGGPNPVVNLNLFEDINIEAEYRGSELVYGEGVIHNYSIGEHDWFYASFSVMNDAVNGVIRCEDGALYTLSHVGDGEHTISKIDPSLHEPCGTDSLRDTVKHPAPHGGSSGGSRATGHTSHIMIVFTTNCVTANGGIDGANALANLAVSETNRSLAQGDSTFRMNLVHTYEDTVYVQSGSQTTDRNRLKDPADGFMDGVHAIRDQYGADFVELFISGYGSGIAYINCDLTTAFEDSAFSVGRDTRVVSSFTLAHELGHNFGLRHDKAADPSTCTNEYAHGYITPSTAYRSVMAYTPGIRIPIFSNPDMLAPNGEAMGVAGATGEDCSRHIGENYPSFVGFRGGVSFYHQITTTYAGGNGASGNMFDIRPKTDISFTQIGVNSDSPAGTSIDVDVYFRDGTYLGNEGSSSGWTLLASLTGISNGVGVETVLDLPFSAEDIVFEQDEIYGIFVNHVSTYVEYTNGTDTYEDSFLRIETGCGKGSGSFSGSTFADRTWNGTFYYQGGVGEHYLETLMTGGISTFNGNMFDIAVHEDLVISSFDVNSTTPAGDVTAFDIWYREGSYVGNENDPGAWTYLGTDTKAVSAGQGAYTNLAISTPELDAGTTYGFYIHSSQDTVDYSSGSGTFYNSDMTLTTGAGLNGPNSFGTVVDPRTWNGRLQYRSSSDSPHLTVRNLVAGQVVYVEMSNCTPGGSLIAAYSTRGGGPISTPYGNVYLTPPYKQLPVGTADSAGEYVWGSGVPSGTAGYSVWLHALDLGSGILTNPVVAVIE